MKIKIINGPNLNLLGKREVGVYGDRTYQDLCDMIDLYCKKQSIEVDVMQTNHEGLIIDEIQSITEKSYTGLIINPGGYTHYSIAIRDALASITIPIVEVHLSDIYNREDFRKVNVIHDVVDFSVIGKGYNGYIEAIKYLHQSNL